MVISPLIVAATVALASPPDDEFYLSLMEGPTDCAVASYHALAALSRPAAVQCLRRLVSTIKPEGSVLDGLFSGADNPVFLSELEDWVATENNLGIRIRVLVALANCGHVSAPAITEAFEQSKTHREGSACRATLARLLGRVGQRAVQSLEPLLKAGDVVAAEAAIFSLGRILGRDSRDFVKPYLGDPRPFVAAAAIETLAKYVGPEAWDDIAGSSYDRCPATNTAFHRAVYYLRIGPLADLSAKEFSCADPRVRLSAARCFARIADRGQVYKWLFSTDIDPATKTAFDEVLFARPPFSPVWFKYLDEFDPNVARLNVRFTNFDPDRIAQTIILDAERIIQAFMALPPR